MSVILIISSECLSLCSRVENVGHQECQKDPKLKEKQVPESSETSQEKRRPGVREEEMEVESTRKEMPGEADRRITVASSDQRVIAERPKDDRRIIQVLLRRVALVYLYYGEGAISRPRIEWLF
jgi:hypothetical protein